MPTAPVNPTPKDAAETLPGEPGLTPPAEELKRTGVGGDGMAYSQLSPEAQKFARDEWREDQKNLPGNVRQPAEIDALSDYQVTSEIINSGIRFTADGEALVR